MIEKDDVECAFERSWSIDDEDITVDVIDNKIKLSGVAQSLYQKE